MEYLLRANGENVLSCEKVLNITAFIYTPLCEDTVGIWGFFVIMQVLMAYILLGIIFLGWCMLKLRLDIDRSEESVLPKKTKRFDHFHSMKLSTNLRSSRKLMEIERAERNKFDLPTLFERSTSFGMATPYQVFGDKDKQEKYLALEGKYNKIFNH